ncbi:MAG: family transposase [Cypionkella sp.]|nr:family transposase [Cypionkella sp.]
MTPAAKRQAVAHLVAIHEMSDAVARQAIAKQSAERGRACRVIGSCRMTMRYEGVRQDDPVLRDQLKELAKARRRFGYRRLHVFLRREGFDLNHKRLFRIYREEQLHVRRPGRAQAGYGHTSPNGAALDAEPALVSGLRVRQADGWTPVQDHDGCR